MENLLTELDAAALLALAATRETLPGLSAAVHVGESRLLDMIEGHEPMPRRVVRYLGLRRVVRYAKAR